MLGFNVKIVLGNISHFIVKVVLTVHLGIL